MVCKKAAGDLGNFEFPSTDLGRGMTFMEGSEAGPEICYRWGCGPRMIEAVNPYRSCEVFGYNLYLFL